MDEQHISPALPELADNPPTLRTISGPTQIDVLDHVARQINDGMTKKLDAEIMASKPAMAKQKRRIAAWLAKHDMTLADVGVDHPKQVSELDDPDVIQSLLDDIEEEKARR